MNTLIDSSTLIYFCVITSIIVWIILLFGIYYFITKEQLKKHVDELEGTWENNSEEYHRDYNKHVDEKNRKLDAYIIRYLKRSCFNCRTFDENAKDDYFCVVEGQCPGIDLIKSQKLLIKSEKEEWWSKIIKD